MDPGPRPVGPGLGGTALRSLTPQHVAQVLQPEIGAREIEERRVHGLGRVQLEGLVLVGAPPDAQAQLPGLVGGQHALAQDVDMAATIDDADLDRIGDQPLHMRGEGEEVPRAVRRAQFVRRLDGEQRCQRAVGHRGHGERIGAGKAA